MHKPHDKHSPVRRPDVGDFHRNEWAFIGAPCGTIQALVAKLIPALAAHYTLAYVDADHAAADAAEPLPVPGAAVVLTDKINYHRYDFGQPLSVFQQRAQLQAASGVLVNGNHFRAKRQVVILDPKKRESLAKKLDQLTDVVLILSTPEQPEPYDFLLEHLAGKRPFVMPLGDTNGILQWLRAQLTHAIPPLYGLVLAGGKSQRMGEDKGLIAYHGMPQREYMAGLLGGVCEQVFYSTRPGQDGLPTDGAVIEDTFLELGPYGAILSAFRMFPDVAWFVVACDLPLVGVDTLAHLVHQRHSGRLATAFHNPATSWPDPLMTIWEPRAYHTLLTYLAQGYSCPRKVLINAGAHVVPLPDEKWLWNANSPADREMIQRILSLDNTDKPERAARRPAQRSEQQQG